MSLRLVFRLVLTITFVIAWPVAAQSPYFNEYVDHKKFIALPEADKRQFLLAVMQTLADMEQEMIENGAMNDAPEEKTVRQQRWEQVQRILKRLNELAMPSAYAAGTQYWGRCHNRQGNDIRTSGEVETCIYGSYQSTFVQVGDRRICQRPACSVDEDIRRQHDQLASTSGCRGTEMACNPMMFGYEEYPASGTPTRASCVPMDSGGRSVDHNATLACMMMVVRDPAQKDNRLDQIARRIATDPSTAVEFGRLLHAITNLCICDGRMNERAPDWVTRMSAAYAGYMKDHRTCNALLSQTSMILEKLTPSTGACVSVVLPPGIQNFANDLSFIRNFSANFTNLMGASGDQPISRENLNRALIQYSNRWVVDRASPGTASGSDVLRTDADKALDNITEYQTAVAALKARPAGATSWCPLPYPELPSSCVMSGTTATRGEDGKVNVNATVALPDGVRGTISNVVWKTGETTFEGQTAETLAVTNFEGIAASATSVPLSASFQLNGNPVSCTGTASFPEAGPSCAITIGDLTPHTDGKLKASVSVAFTGINPDAVTWTPNDVASGTAGTVDRERVVAFTPPTGDGARQVRVSISATTGNQNVSCEAPKDLPAQPQTTSNTCTLSPTVTAAEDGKYNVSLRLNNMSATDNPDEGTTVAFSGMELTVNNNVGMGQVSSTAQIQNIPVTATYTKSGGRNYSCTVRVIIPAQASAAPGFAPQQQQPMPTPPIGGPLLRPGLR
jgi:hypothetical protein